MNQKPNIVMIITDDQGHWGMGCSGNKDILTPNLDRLANEGIRFNEFFCASPVCSAARGSIFTGKIPSQHGIHDWISKGHASESDLSEKLQSEFKNEERHWAYNWPKDQLQGDVALNYLEGQTCFTQILNKHGYTCGLSGKWHLGNSAIPQAGFTYWKTLAMGGDNYYYPVVLENGKFVMKEKVYVTDYITDNALTFLEEQKGKEEPFYLSIHYTAPHAPWDKHQHPERFYDLYEDCQFTSIPFEPAHPWAGMKYGQDEQGKEQWRRWIQGYAAATTAMDENVGRILEKLEQDGLMDNTLIIFTGDNGMSMGHHGIFGKGNGTFPLNLYDTAVKVPMIMRVPGATVSGKVEETLLSHYDLFPTIMTYLGLENEIPDHLPGSSFASVLEGSEGKVVDRDIVIFDEYGPNRMIRTKEWKYIHRYPYGPHELYDLKNDPDEKHNVVDEVSYQEVKAMMKQKLEAWYLEYVDPTRDGKGEAVTGNGQIGLCGARAEGKPAFKA